MNGYVYVVRHGVTHWNQQKRLQGEAEVPLSADGIAQAELVSAALSDANISQMYSSPRDRVISTAKKILLNRTETPFFVDERLSEIRFGEVSGMTLEEVAISRPGLLEKLEKDKWFAEWPGGESLEDVRIRLEHFLMEYEIRDKIQMGKDILFLAHETSNKILMGALLGWTQSFTLSVRQPNTVIYRIKERETARLDARDFSQGWMQGVLRKQSSGR